MNNFAYMTDAFEREKNIKASAITLGVAILMAMLFILVKWQIPTVSQPVVQDDIEVNLGSDDIGSGKSQPMLPGQPAPAKQIAYTPPQPIHAAASNAKDVETDERDADAPAITKPAVTKPNATKIDENNKVIKTVNTALAPVVTATPPKPKAVLGHVTGSNGNGGNGAETYQPGSGEGVTGGNGDQGQPGGSPNGKNYNGPKRNFGVKVFNIPNQSFEDDFNENAKVAMDIVTDDNGKVVAANFQPRGSTTSDRKYVDIARRSAFQLKMGNTDGAQKGTVVFSFKVKG